MAVAGTTTTTGPPITEFSPLPVWHPLSDRLRWIKVAALIALLGAGAVHLSWRLDRLIVRVDEMMADPDVYAGEPVLLGNFKVLAIENGEAELWSPWIVVRVRPIPAGLEVGHAVSLSGSFDGKSGVDAEHWRIHRELIVKKAIGILSLLLCLALATWDLWLLRRSRA